MPLQPLPRGPSRSLDAKRTCSVRIPRLIPPSFPMSQPQRLPERPCRHTATQRVRRGAVLVEFAFVALGFYVLLMGTVEIGRMILSSQLLNNAARVGARELAMMPLPATMTFEPFMPARCWIAPLIPTAT